MDENFKILLATDYSNEAIDAEYYAVLFAKFTSSQLEVLHVYPPSFSSIIDSFNFEKTDANPVEYELTKLIDHVDGLLATLNITPDELQYSCVVREGKIINQIRGEISEIKADLIIIGTRNSNSFRELLLGSHTWDMIKRSNVPVLVVPKGTLFNEIQTVIFATECHEEDITALDFLVEFTKEFNANIIVLNITNYVLSGKFEKVLFEKFSETLKKRMSYKKSNMQMAHYDNIIEGLNDFCIRSNASWLAMPVGKKPLIKKAFDPIANTTRKMSFHTRLPLLAIPLADNAKNAEKIYEEIAENN
ncbi:MAG: universal stress protein [Bacteroidetes bacterium]|nr:universal stress protein [Bacteroidota bacterium]